MVLPQGGVHLFQGGSTPPPTGWLDKPLGHWRYLFDVVQMIGGLWSAAWVTARRDVDDRPVVRPMYLIPALLVL